MTFTRRHFGCAVCGAALLAAVRPALGEVVSSDPARPFVAPGYRPPPESDEKGLWSLMDRAERELKASRFVVRDPEVNAYVRDVVCRLSKDYCPDIRIYIVRTPHFNASMAPNGMMQVWTGLLLRCHDEAQLAAILGHEMGHYLRRHTVERWRDVRKKADFGTFLSMGLGVAGLGLVGSLAQFAIVASVFAFNRDQEREADEIGLNLIADAGYNPVATAEVWAQLLAEFKGSTGERDKSVLLATHPEPEQRLKTMGDIAAKRGGDKGERGRERYRTRLATMQARLLADEIGLRQYGRSEIVVDRWLADAPDDGRLWFAKGEIYRLRADSEDPGRARAAYQRALEAKDAPAETHRSMMLIELKLGARERAQAAYDAYIKAKPDAGDAEGLRMLLTP